jgi:SPP1 family predicted phage head-tail adaptor
MLHADAIILIAESPKAHGVFDSKTETTRRVPCTVRSVGMQENYIARGQGLKPELVFQLRHAFEYKGEKRCIYHDTEYRIIRTYITEMDGIEITVERSNQDD